MICKKRSMSLFACLTVLFISLSLLLSFFVSISFSDDGMTETELPDTPYITQAVGMCVPIDTEHAGRYTAFEPLSVGVRDKTQRTDAFLPAPSALLKASGLLCRVLSMFMLGFDRSPQDTGTVMLC